MTTQTSERQLASAWSIGLEALRACRPKPRRSLLEFAESEVVIPDGPYRGRYFRADRLPWTRLLLRAIDSRRWSRIIVTGPSQAGKTLVSWLIPALWLICELEETVILAAPAAATLIDKWRISVEPAILASRYRELMPERGAGSRGGDAKLIRLRNGARVRLMDGQGDDKKRASFTARAALVTETDGMDEKREGSRESDPVTQIEQRTAAYEQGALVILECTASTRDGRTWREYEQSTSSRIATPCPHCGRWVSPEREHLVGWREADSELDAAAAAHWLCPSCAHVITDAERRAANARCVLAHRGQEISADGTVTGPVPGTRTLGFRWSAWSNLLKSTGALGAMEWNASRLAGDAKRNADRALRQFHWALPVERHELEGAEGDESGVDVLDRIDQGMPRGVLPPWTQLVILGVDLGLRMLHWTATAWRADATVHVLEYGIEDTPDAGSEERRILIALRTIRDRAIAGWLHGQVQRRADLMLVDAGWRPDVVKAFAAEPESLGLVRITKGYGDGQPAGRTYSGPRSTGATVKRIGDGWHEVRLAGGHREVQFSADAWKTQLQARIETAPGTPGAFSLYAGDPRDHRRYSAHLRSERLVEEFDPRKGMVRRWRARRAANHWWDSTVLATLGAGMRGVQPTLEAPKEPQTPQEPPVPQTPPSQAPRRERVHRPFPNLL